MSKKNTAQVTSIGTDTIEFTNDGNAPQPQASQDATGEERDDSKATRDHELGGSVYAVELQRNELFSTSGDAIAGFRAWSESDKHSMRWLDRAVKETLVKHAMHREPGKANVAPLTHAVQAMEHRGKKNIAAKLIAFVQAVTNYKWAVDTKSKTARFRLKKDKPVSTTFTLEQQAIFDAPFYDYVKTTKKADFDLLKALKSLVTRADGKGVDQDERARIIALFATGNAPETVTVAAAAGNTTTIRNDLKTPEQIAATTQNNDKDAA